LPPPQLWISVFELGCFAGLVGLGYFLILRGAGLFMFALGPLAMFSAMLGSWLLVEYELPLVVPVLAGIVCVVLFAALVEVLIVRPIQERAGGEELPAIVAVVAVLFATQQLAGTLFGRRPLPGRPWITAGPFRLGDVVISGQAVVLGVVTIVVYGAMMLWMSRSHYGRMLRAVGDNQRAAHTLGLPVSNIRIVAFALAGGVAALAGSLFSAKAGVAFQSGLSWTVAGFLALIVGGLGRVWAPLVGGLLVATMQTMAVFYFGPAMLNYATFVMAFLFFMFRPKGIFAPRVRI